MEKTLGMKFDGEKPRMGLLPPYALEDISKVLTFGAKKYLPNNWKYVEGGAERYLNAALRHINSIQKGELEDPESGLLHLSHAACCIMFLIDLELDPELKKYHAPSTITKMTELNEESTTKSMMAIKPDRAPHQILRDTTDGIHPQYGETYSRYIPETKKENP